MIEVPVALLIAEWLFLLGLGAMVILAYRQLAYVLGLSRAVSSAEGLAVGARAPEFRYILPAPDGGAEERATFTAAGRPALLMFTSPTCPSCQEALRNLDRSTRKLRDDGVLVLAVTDAEPETIRAIDAFKDSQIPVARVEHRVPTRLFHTFTSPFLYAIGPDGSVRGAGAAVTEKEIGRVVRKLR